MLDCRVYAYAALLLSRVRIDLVAKRFEVETTEKEESDEEQTVEHETPTAKRRKGRKSRGNKFTDI